MNSYYIFKCSNVHINEHITFARVHVNIFIYYVAHIQHAAPHPHVRPTVIFYTRTCCMLHIEYIVGIIKYHTSV